MKAFKIILVVITLVPLLIWAAGGPILRAFLNKNSHAIISDVEVKSDNHIKIGSVSGDLWSGIKLERIIVYADKDPEHLPLLTADEIHLKISIWDVFNEDVTPTSIHIQGFNAVLHIDDEGNIILPEWELQTARSHPEPHLAGYSFSRNSSEAVLITCEDGLLEIYKRFPGLTESVDIVFTQLEGSGEYVYQDGFYIDSITGDYLSTPISVSGYVPQESSETMNVSATIGEVNLPSLFRDIDPLFRDNEYLPGGLAQGGIHMAGPSGHLAVAGTIELANASVGNIQVDVARGSVAYSAGVIDLTAVTAEAYGGAITGSARINMLSEVPIWTSVCTFQELDIPAYLTDAEYLAYEMTGEFAGVIDARGDFVNPDSLSCTVELRSGGGRFLTPFSEKFLTVAGVAKSTDIEITDEDLADYDILVLNATIQQSSIGLDRFHFVSTDLEVDARGQVGFDKTISASGGLTVPADLARRHPRFGTFMEFLPDTLNRVSLEFEISGTLSEPKFEPMLTENFLLGLLDQGSDLGHDVLDSFTGLD